MSDHVNGAPTSVSIDAQLDAMLFPVVNMMVRGAITTINGVTPDKILIAVCRQLGKATGVSFSVGDLAPCMAARRRAREAFEEGIKSVPFSAIGPVPQQPKPHGV